MVGDIDRGAGRRAAERSRLVVVANDTVAPRPVCILSDRVRADSQTGDGLPFAVLEHDGGHDLTGAVLDIEHERLVRVRTVAGDGLGDRQAAGVDRDGERSIFRNALIRSTLRRRNRARHLVGRCLLRGDSAVAFPRPRSFAAGFPGEDFVRADRFAVFVLDRVGHIHVLVVHPVKLRNVCCDTVRQICCLTEVNRRVSHLRNDRLHRHIHVLRCKLLDRLLTCLARRIDAVIRANVRLHAVAAEEGIRRLNLEFDDQLLTAINRIAARIHVRSTPIGRVIKPGDRNGVVAHRGLNIAGCSRLCAEDQLSAAVRAGAGRRFQRDLRVRAARNFKVRRHCVLEYGTACQLRVRTADLTADVFENIVELRRIAGREIVGFASGRIGACSGA